MQIEEYLEKLKNELSQWAKTSEYNKIVKDISGLVSLHKKFEKERLQLEYEVDGLVYKVNNLKLQKRLGNVANAPRWAIAHKFSANSAVSKIENIELLVIIISWMKVILL